MHRIDPRVKILLTVVYIVIVTSHSRYAVTRLLPFAAFPVLFAAAANVPTGFLLRKLLLVSPFAVMVGIFNPLFDRAILLSIGGIEISGGWISFASILIRFSLCMSAALVLITTTGFYRICSSLQRLKVPAVLTVQLLLLYRYLFLLVEEAIRLVLARNLRTFGSRGEGLKSTGALIASLLARTLQRAKRIHEAMCARGLHVTLPDLESTRMRRTDILLLLTLLLGFALLRVYDVPQAIGYLITGGLR